MENIINEPTPSFCKKYDSVTRIFRNWYIVEKMMDSYCIRGIVDSYNNIILPLEKGYIFANDDMVFVNREKSFVLDPNGNFICEPQENVFYSTDDLIGI